MTNFWWCSRWCPRSYLKKTLSLRNVLLGGGLTSSSAFLVLFAKTLVASCWGNICLHGAALKRNLGLLVFSSIRGIIGSSLLTEAVFINIWLSFQARRLSFSLNKHHISPIHGAALILNDSKEQAFHESLPSRVLHQKNKLTSGGLRLMLLALVMQTHGGPGKDHFLGFVWSNCWP